MASEVVDRLAKASIQAKVALLLVILALLGLVYYQLLYSDAVSERDGLVAVKKRQIEDERRLVKRKAEYQELLREKADVEERLRRNAIKLPESSELPAFFQHLETQAATANVRILNRTIEKEVPVESYLRVPVHMEVAGDFYQLNNYFKLLSETARIITIENLSIGDARREGERVVLTAKFTASTFRQADKKPAAPAAQAGAPAAAPAAAPAPAPAPAPAAPEIPTSAKEAAPAPAPAPAKPPEAPPAPPSGGGK